MSTPTPGPTPGPTPYPPPNAAQPLPPPKKRPSGWWFGVGGALLLLGALSLGVAGSMVIRFFVDADTSIPMAGTHRVHLPAHTQRMVFGDGDTEGAFCSAHEPRGTAVRFRPLGGESRAEDHASDFARFDTGDGRLVFQCFGSAGDTLWITPVPSRSSLVWLILLGAVGPFVLGGIGVLVLLVTTVLWVSRRPAPAPHAPPPGYAGPPTT